MATVYAAAEKLLKWDEDVNICVNKEVLHSLIVHARNNRIVVYFAPARFGLSYDERSEVNDAWHYLSTTLSQHGFEPDDVILFDDEVNETPFSSDIESQPIHNSVAFILSDAPQDEVLSLSLGFQLIHEIPADISSQWPKLDIRRTLRSIIAAALNI